jgi:hypothetical protein
VDVIQGTHRSIFRTDAIRRYAQDQSKAILPRFVCPRTFLYLWILLGLLLLGATYVVWVARGPVLGHVMIEYQQQGVILSDEKPQSA